MEKNGTTYTETLGTGVFTTAGADVANGDTATIGNRTYTFVTALSEAKATQTLTSDATAPSDGDTVTIVGKQYTYKTTLSSPAQQNEVLIGASAAIALDNLKQAINQGDTAYPTAPTNEGRGTNYSNDTVRHSLVTATTNTNTTQVVQANVFGTDGNAYDVAENSTHLSWGAAALSGGAAVVPDQIKIGSSAADTLDKFKDAINNTSVVGTEGVDYSTGTRAHQQVTATTNTNTAQTVASRNAAFDNASIGTVMTGGGNMAAGAATLASGVRGVVALNTTTYAGSAGVSGDKNLI